MNVNLECASCGFIFNAELGQLQMDAIGTLHYEKKPICPKCKAFDQVLITPEGFKQLNEWFLNYLNQKK